MNEYAIIALIYLAFLILFFVNLTVNLVRYFKGRKTVGKIDKFRENNMSNGVDSIINKDMINSIDNDFRQLSKIDTVNDITYSSMVGNIYHDMNNTNNNSMHES
ncbi:MAG: hypothetical protein K2P99_03765 [Burkholderiales bacterium]|nr:hypothetical protein [Burkholderiales bacterium]